MKLIEFEKYINKTKLRDYKIREHKKIETGKEIADTNRFNNNDFISNISNSRTLIVGSCLCGKIMS